MKKKPLFVVLLVLLVLLYGVLLSSCGHPNPAETKTEDGPVSTEEITQEDSATTEEPNKTDESSTEQVPEQKQIEQEYKSATKQDNSDRQVDSQMVVEFPDIELSDVIERTDSTPEPIQSDQIGMQQPPLPVLQDNPEDGIELPDLPFD